jgi:Kef-type K+ transport system membrane component KefB
LPALNSLATLGVVLFMFIVGAELRAPSGLGAQLRSAAWVGLSSMALPMALGVLIAPLLHPTLAPAGVGLLPFSLFMGVSLSITAFPVLARILVVALASAGAGLHAFARITLGLAVVIAVVFLVVRPLLLRLIAKGAPDGVPSHAVLAVLMIGLFSCAMLTEWLHLHAVFGAFIFGISLPRDDRLTHALAERLEPLSVVVLMPIFFALAGLNTSANAFVGAGLGAMGLILLVACVGKIVGATAGARISGYGWRESLATGALMNSRGLMELIVIKVGLDVGLIGPALFTMLLLMALITTAATGPLLTLIGRQRDEPVDAAARPR